MTGDSSSRHAGGWSFCNGYGAAYVLGPGDRLGFRHFQSTLVGCDGPDSLETRYFRALGNTRRFEMDETTLTLLAEDGSRLTFVAASDSATNRPR
jgi:heat shock protein HslJ